MSDEDYERRLRTAWMYLDSYLNRRRAARTNAILAERLPMGERAVARLQRMIDRGRWQGVPIADMTRRELEKAYVLTLFRAEIAEKALADVADKEDEDGTQV